MAAASKPMFFETWRGQTTNKIVKESRCAAEPVFKSSAAREENNGVIHKLLMGNSFLALWSTDMDDFLLLLLQCTTYVHLLEWDEVCHKEYLIWRLILGDEISSFPFV